MSLTAAQLTQLVSEIANDPKALGYAALVSAHNRPGLAAKLNATYAQVGTVYRQDVAAKEILAAMIEAEVSLLTETKHIRVLCLLGGQTVDASKQNIRDQFQGIFAGCTNTIIGIATLIQIVAPTRAEELWGQGTVVRDTDVAAAGVG